MLEVTAADRPEPLVERLVARLTVPLADPFTPEVVVVPSLGMRSWLTAQLAEHLGASHLGSDGITANIDLCFPGSLRSRLLGSTREVDDPWQVDRLALAVLDVLRRTPGDPALGPAGTDLSGGTWYGRARRIADLLDRYGLHRPALVQAWAAGAAVDTAGETLRPADRWQYELFTRVRAQLGTRAPAERLPLLLDELAAGTARADLPERVTLIGLSTFPAGLLDPLVALGEQRSVLLLWLAPSPTQFGSLLDRPLPSGSRATWRSPLLRRDDPAPTVDGGHPLLRSWGQAAREAAVELGRLGQAGAASVRAPSTSSIPPGHLDESLLACVQREIRGDTPPSGTHRLADGDRSLVIHQGAGPTRQVEILRDEICHRLADDPTLTEDDIAVLCPDLERFAPLISAVFGPPSLDHPPRAPCGDTPPPLRYQVVGTGAVGHDPVLDAVLATLDVASGRAPASAVLDLCGQPAVRHRFRFADDDLATIAAWADETAVRWGLDGSHRHEHGFPADFTSNTWQATLDQLLAGVAVTSSDLGLAIGAIAPTDCEGDRAALAGRLAEVLAQLRLLHDDLRADRTLGQWCDLLVELADTFTAVPWELSWSRSRFERLMVELRARAGRGADPALSLGDLRRLLLDRSAGAGSRASLPVGSLVVSTLPLRRSVPHRVVCVLGLDEGTVGPPADGDDLIARHPCVGDRDARAEARQLLLEAVLSAREALVLTCSGIDLRTGADVPEAVAMAELRDAVRASVDPADHEALERQLAVRHPRQSSAEPEFQTGGPHPAGPWSFDGRALAGARGRRRRPAVPRPSDGMLCVDPLPDHPATTVELADLGRFLGDPVTAFFAQRLGVRFPRDTGDGVDDGLPVTLDPLERYELGDDLLVSRRRGLEVSRWRRQVVARGLVLVEPFGGNDLDDVTEEIDRMITAVSRARRQFGPQPPRELTIPLVTPAGRAVALHGVVRGCDAHGPVDLAYSRFKPVHRLRSWLDLLALTVLRPDRDQRALIVRRPPSGTDLSIECFAARGDDPTERAARAEQALGTIVDLWWRGMREPLPLFPKTSHPLAHGDLGTARRAWDEGFNGGEADATAVRLAFGSRTFDELLAIPCRADDPGDTADPRARALAEHLWATFDDSVDELDLTGAEA